MITITVDNRVRISAEDLKRLGRSLVDRLKEMGVHENPEFEKWLRYKRGPKPSQHIRTFREDRMGLSLPRGCLEDILAIPEFKPSKVLFNQTDRPITEAAQAFKWNGPPLWEAQERLVYSFTSRFGLATSRLGVWRSPPGSGKTCATLYLVHKMQQRTLVICPSEAVFKQWQDRAKEWLGVEPGIIKGSKRIIRDITIAMQQTLFNCAEEFANEFGFVIVDECFVGSAQILMEDGSIKRIDEIRAGDRVAVGGLVREVKSRHYEGELLNLAGGCTPTHPIATNKGWLSGSNVNGSDLLWYDPLHEKRMCGLRSANEEILQAGSLQIPPIWGLRGRWDLSKVWEGGFSKVERNPYVTQVRDSGALEQGSKVRCSKLEQGVDQRNSSISNQYLGEVERDSSESRFQGDSFIRGQYCSEETVLQARRGGEVSANCQTVNSTGEVSTIRRETIRQWRTVDDLRTGDAEETSRFCISIRGEDEACSSGGNPQPLQDRFSGSSLYDCDRDRWDKPSQEASKRIRYSEGYGVVETWLEGHSLPSAVRLRQGCSNLQRLAVEYSGTVYNLETETGVYVAGGVLVHNCQKTASRTYQDVIDVFSAKYRLGVSGDERRADGKEFLIYDQFGSHVEEVTKSECLEAGTLVDTDIIVVETDFRFPDYVSLPKEKESQIKRKGGGPKEIATALAQHRFDVRPKLDEAMYKDVDRNALIVSIARRCLAEGQHVVCLSTRREHCLMLDAMLSAFAPTVRFMGDDEDFEQSRDRFAKGEVKCAVGTYKKIGVGFEACRELGRGILSIPFSVSGSGGRMEMAQFTGRFARAAKGKKNAKVYYLHDVHVFGDKPVKLFKSWYDRVFVLTLQGRMLPVREYLKARNQKESDETKDSEPDDGSEIFQRGFGFD